MKTYEIKTAWSNHVVLANSFEQAFGIAQKILAAEHEGCRKEKLELESYPNITSIVEGDEIDEIK